MEITNDLYSDRNFMNLEKVLQKMISVQEGESPEYVEFINDLKKDLETVESENLKKLIENYHMKLTHLNNFYEQKLRMETI